MMNRRIETVLVGVTILALGAGIAAGMLASRLPWRAARVPTPSTHPVRGTPLAEALQLTPQQAEQMRAIWESARRDVHATFEDAQRLQSDRDDALTAILNDEQRRAFAKISEDYAARFAALSEKRDATFQEAVNATNELLDESQRRRYDQILKDHVGPGGLPRGADRMPTPATRPSK